MAAILAVDDSKVIIKQYEKFSSEFCPDLNFISANDGVDAVELLKDFSDTIEVAIIDYNMKEMNGIELVENIIDRVDPSKIVICSANLQESLKEKVDQLKISFVPKPINAAKFQEILERTKK